MNTRNNTMRYLPSVIAATLIALSLAVTGCGNTETAKPAEKAAAKKDEHRDEGLLKVSAEEIQRAGIRSEALEAAEVRDELVVTATVKPNQDAVVRIAPRVPGRLVQAPAHLGDAVKAGQVLAVLDSIEVGEAHSAYLLAATESKLAATAFERAERLHADQIIATKDYQRARAEHDKTRAQLVSATDKLRMLGIAPRGVPGESAVSTFPLISPIAGVVIEKKARIGELAKPDEPVFTIANLSVLWIEADIVEKDLARVRRGAEARVSVTAYPNEVFAGKVTYVGAMMDKETRTVRARIEVPNPKGELKPEMFATASIATDSVRKVLAIPESAVTLIQGLPTVYVEEGEGFEARSIEIAERVGGRVIVKSGIKAGELVVVGGVYALKARQLKSQIGEGHAH
jgi:cobalt-zinc-cadmium efflux system membrane fusion protein